MKIYLILLLLIGKSAAAFTQEKVNSLEERVNTVERRVGSVRRKVENIGSKMEQLLISFQEHFGQTGTYLYLGPGAGSADSSEIVTVNSYGVTSLQCYTVP